MIHDIINLGLIIVLAINIYKNKVNKLSKEQMAPSTESQQNDTIISLKHRDISVINNPVIAPERRVEIDQYPNKLIKLNERTRGEPDDYQLQGLLYNTELNKNYQLYGRRKYPGAYEWEYYVRGMDVGGLDIKFPLDTNQEIQNASIITLPIDNNPFTVKIYNFNQPRYNPFDTF